MTDRRTAVYHNAPGARPAAPRPSYSNNMQGCEVTLRQLSLFFSLHLLQ